MMIKYEAAIDVIPGSMKVKRIMLKAIDELEAWDKARAYCVKHKMYGARVMTVKELVT